jgi:redox-sensing transcriptional repressor
LTVILGLDRPHRAAIIGAGNLGSALAGYYGWSASNFSVVAVFDTDPDKIGLRVGANATLVQPLANLNRVVEEELVDVAVIAVPGAAAQSVLNTVMDAGIKAVLNFAPARLYPRPGVKIKTVDLTVSLETLSFFLARPSTPFVNPNGNGAAKYAAGMNGDEHLHGAD